MFATRLKDVAARLLSTYGSAVTVTRTLSGTYDTTTGEISGQVVIMYTGYGNPSTYTFLEKLNSEIKETDVKFLFSTTTRPLVGDVFNIDDTDMRVQSVGITDAQGQDIMYTLQLRVD